MVSIIHIEALHRFKFDRLIREQEKFHKDWIKKRKCLCVQTLSKGRVMTCQHYKTAKKEKFQEEEEKIKKLFLFLFKLELYNNPEFPNEWLHLLNK